jgi:hypothetical protein
MAADSDRASTAPPSRGIRSVSGGRCGGSLLLEPPQWAAAVAQTVSIVNNGLPHFLLILIGGLSWQDGMDYTLRGGLTLSRVPATRGRGGCVWDEVPRTPSSDASADVLAGCIELDTLSARVYRHIAIEHNHDGTGTSHDKIRAIEQQQLVKTYRVLVSGDNRVGHVPGVKSPPVSACIARPGIVIRRHDAATGERLFTFAISYRRRRWSARSPCLTEDMSLEVISRGRSPLESVLPPRTRSEGRPREELRKYPAVTNHLFRGSGVARQPC